MKFLHLLFVSLLIATITTGQSVFKNPGISESESFVITDFIDNIIGHVETKIDISPKERNNQKYYNIHIEKRITYQIYFLSLLHPV